MSDQLQFLFSFRNIARQISHEISRQERESDLRESDLARKLRPMRHESVRVRGPCMSENTAS